MAKRKKSPIFGETLIPLTRFSATYPFAPSYRQLWRYSKFGMLNTFGPKPRRVYLEVVKLPGGLATSVLAFKRFIAAINEQSDE